MRLRGYAFALLIACSCSTQKVSATPDAGDCEPGEQCPGKDCFPYAHECVEAGGTCYPCYEECTGPAPGQTEVAYESCNPVGCEGVASHCYVWSPEAGPRDAGADALVDGGLDATGDTQEDVATDTAGE
jgi:hypothetical protein